MKLRYPKVVGKMSLDQIVWVEDVSFVDLNRRCSKRMFIQQLIVPWMFLPKYHHGWSTNQPPLDVPPSEIRV